MRVRAYECSVEELGFARTICAMSPGKARSEYWRDLRESYPRLPYIAVRVRGVRAPETSDEFRRVANYRGVPCACVGMCVEAEGHRGIIVGHNSSANFDVLFEDGPHHGLKLNCHPNWRMTYFDREGNVLARFDDGCRREEVPAQ